MIAESMYYQIVLEWFKGNYDYGIELAQKLLRYTKTHTLPRQHAYTLNVLSNLYGEKGDLENLTTFLNSAISHFTEMKMRNPLVTALNNQALSFNLQGDLKSASSAFLKALSSAQQINNKTAQIFALSNLANITNDSGNFKEALRFLKMLSTLKPNYSYTDFNQAIIYYRSGDLDKATTLLEKTLDIFVIVFGKPPRFAERESPPPLLYVFKNPINGFLSVNSTYVPQYSYDAQRLHFIRIIEDLRFNAVSLFRSGRDVVDTYGV